MARLIEEFNNGLTQSHTLKIALILFLILMLQIPIYMVEDLNRERDSSRQLATAEVTNKWGESQTIVGPKIIIPYYYYVKKTQKDGDPRVKQLLSNVVFLPKTMTIDGKLAHEYRYRGIYKIPLYQADLRIEGSFNKPDFSVWNIEDKDILWDRARLVLGVSDARAIQEHINLTWNKDVIAFEPGTNEPGADNPGFHAPLKGQLEGASYHYSVQIKLNGSRSIYFAPVGKTSLIKLESNWLNPSFQGKWLPTEREINEQGFVAKWAIPYLGRDFPQQWQRASGVTDKVHATTVGVNFISPVDNYRMVERSVKYQSLFLLLTFTVIWLFEVLSRVRVHPLQYLLIGGAMCLFYLLELSLSEHIGLIAAYSIASIAIVSISAAYSLAVLKTGKRAAILGSVMAVLYSYLFVLLKEQDYALLFGSVGLFLALAAVMYLTRNIDWYAMNPKPAANSEALS